MDGFQHSHSIAGTQVKYFTQNIAFILFQVFKSKCMGMSYRWCLDILEGATLAASDQVIASDYLKTGIRLLESMFDGSDGLSWPTVPDRRMYIEN